MFSHFNEVSRERYSGIPFIKMHSLGNDILILPGWYSLSEASVQTICHRNFGVGCDQLMMISGDVSGRQLSIWNRDGSKAKACGNGTRCVLEYLNTPAMEKITLQGPVGSLTGWKTLTGDIAIQQGHVAPFAVQSQGLPEASTSSEVVDLSRYNLPKGVAVEVGNPHLVVLVEDLPKVETFRELGACISTSPLFPEGVNVSFVNKRTYQVLVWERGVGPTLGCGSAACAIAYLLLKDQRHHYNSAVTLSMPGGSIEVNYTPQGWVHTAKASMVAQGWITSLF